MVLKNFLKYLTMLFATDLWAVYGIQLEPRDVHTTECEICIKPTPSSLSIPSWTYGDQPTDNNGILWLTKTIPQPTQHTVPTQSQHDLKIAIDTRSSPSPFLAYDTATPVQVTHSAAPSALSSGITQGATASPAALSAAGAVGIGVGVAGLVLIIAFVMIGIPHMQRWRQRRALWRAVSEVEHGVEMQTIRGASVDGSKENMVLESRVEIFVEGEEEEEEEGEVNVLDKWNGWDARGDVGVYVHDEDDGRGRKGMSLPKREY